MSSFKCNVFFYVNHFELLWIKHIKLIVLLQVDTVNNISIPAGLSLNSAVSIIPTSPHKGPNISNKTSNVSKKVNHIIIMH